MQSKILSHIRTNSYTYLTALTLCVASYLCLTNLNYSLLWEDEANTAIIGNNLLNTGTLTAWDGRNLISDKNGMNLNSKLQEVLPPLQYVFSALGIAIFGYNEIGARSVHAFIGVLALLMFLLLLKQYFPDNHRLRCLIFLFVALSPQLLLYFRSARYFSFAVFSFIACFYFYEQYWRSNRYRHLISMTIFGLLGFLNNYSIGAAGMLSIALYHLILREPDTSKKQWLMFSAAGLFIVVAGGAYLYSVGVIQFDHEMYSYYSGDQAIFSNISLKVIWAIKTALALGWISLFVCLWFFLICCKAATPTSNCDFAHIVKIILIGALFFLLSTLLSPHMQQETRMAIAAIPFLLVMKAALIQWLLCKSKIIAMVALPLLLVSSADALPFTMINAKTGESTHGFHLLSFIKEIHRPYRPDPIDAVAKYLYQHAKQDDLVYVPDPDFGDRFNLVPYVGDHILLCCQIDKEHSRLTSLLSKLRSSLFLAPEVIPDWIVMFAPNKDDNSAWQQFQHVYHRNWTLTNIPILAEQTQRPEIELHSFDPYPMPRHGGIHILQRKQDASDTWF